MKRHGHPFLAGVHLAALLPLLLATLLAPACTSPAPLPKPQLQPAADPARFQDAIDAFARADAEQPSPPGAVLFTGSSSIRLWPLETAFPHLPTVNRGFGGSQFSDAIHFFEALVPPHAPSAIVLYEGDNDINAGLSPQQVRDHFRILIALIRERQPDVPVLFLSIKPSVSREALWPSMQEANAMIRALCDADTNLHYVDVASPLLDATGQPRPELFEDDMLHLNPKGYALWDQVVGPAIKRHADPAQLRHAIAAME